jgi:hypothetical protein
MHAFMGTDLTPVKLVRIGDSLSEEERQRVLTSCLHYCMTVVVDGFGKVKKCTDEGRMLMSVDFSSLIRNLERVTRVSPIPNSKYVEEYIGCFFIPDNQLLDWVQVHPEYPPKHVLAVMSLMTVKYDMKRSKKKEFIEEVEKILRANGHTVEEHSSLSLFGMPFPPPPTHQPRLSVCCPPFVHFLTRKLTLVLGV